MYSGCLHLGIYVFSLGLCAHLSCMPLGFLTWVVKMHVLEPVQNLILVPPLSWCSMEKPFTLSMPGSPSLYAWDKY